MAGEHGEVGVVAWAEGLVIVVEQEVAVEAAGSCARHCGQGIGVGGGDLYGDEVWMVPLEREPVGGWRVAEACRIVVVELWWLVDGQLGGLVELQLLAEVQLVDLVVPQVVDGC